MALTDAVLAVIRASRPQFRSPHDRVAFALHAAFLASGYSLGATGSAAASGASSEQEVGIDGWNELENAYAFKYFTDEKDLPKSVDVKCTAIGDMLMVDAAVEGGNDLFHLEIKVTDFAKDSDTGNYAQQYKDLDGIVKVVNSQVLSKCSTKPPEPATSTRETGKLMIDDETMSVPRRPYPATPGVSLIGRPVGLNDLLPGPGVGVFDHHRKDSTLESGEAGSLVGPGHPVWGNVPPGHDDPSGLTRPQGARFDPFGPPGVPGFEPQRFGRGGGRGDIQHFPNF
ncbi:probable proteasome inhibitor [Selaginella moellendorffii]|uniref:probable proteasome inhibitor n=1 Tax=Selaginella moellendorffii TaxID=88036 RepID=UPI000D1CB484|nr:probable proteasome inhibitor [Selaginella moellendorffii]|eukprot:XP_024528767.1 probable proteasome inhibitor [Selaginella moellendorffii]